MKRRKHEHNNEEIEDVKRRRHNPNECENDDNKETLSDLPDCVLLHILSFLNAKEAVKTCILSTRWKHLWKRLSTLTLSSSHFATSEGFTKFVTQILSLRDSSTALNALNFHTVCQVKPHLLERIVRYAISHNVHQLGLYCEIEHIQPSLFLSHTLKSLSLMCRDKQKALYLINHKVVFPSNLILPALTTLELCSLAFRPGEDGHAEPFSRFNRLNSLIINDCMVLDGKTLCISSTTIVDLCLNLSYVAEDYSKIDLYAPNLCTFAFHGNPLQNVRGSDLSSLKHLNIDFYKPHPNPVSMLNLLIELAHIESLTVSEVTLEVLNKGRLISNVKLPTLCNLKLLKVKMIPYSSYCLVPKGTIALLLQNAPFAKVCIVNEWS